MDHQWGSFDFASGGGWGWFSTQGVVYWEGDETISGQIDGRPVHGVGYTEINPPAA